MFKSKKLPSNITISTVFAADLDEPIQQTMAYILQDYCKKFNVRPTRKKYHVGITAVDYERRDTFGEMGCTITTSENRILVQIKDPYLEKDSIDAHPYMESLFLIVLCHELVHVCQHLTGRDGTSIEVNKEDTPLDDYYFDPVEIEARILETYYTYKYAYPIIEEYQARKGNSGSRNGRLTGYSLKDLATLY